MKEKLKELQAKLMKSKKTLEEARTSVVKINAWINQLECEVDELNRRILDYIHSIKDKE